MNIIFNDDDNTHGDMSLGRMLFCHAVQEGKTTATLVSPRSDYQIVREGALIFFVRVQVLKQTWIPIKRRVK